MISVRDRIQAAGRMVVLSGAGISAESGVPTFRDAQTGLWARFSPEELATEGAFRAHPQRVWDWYASRRDAIAGVQPNAAHHALAAFARRYPARLTLITQNVDGLHHRAGSPHVLALHGNILQDKWLDACPRQCHAGRDCATSEAEPAHPPRCEACGNLVRPDVVWFGEMLPESVLQQAERAATGCDLMLVVGTSGTVYPAAGLVQLARQAGAYVVIINPVSTALDHLAHACIHAGAAQCLPVILAN